MVALVRRHPNLHVDTSAHRAQYLGQPGSGWEMLIQFGNTLIQDKVLVGLSAGLVGQPYETLIQEYLGPAAQGHRQGEVALPQRGPRLRARVSGDR